MTSKKNIIYRPSRFDPRRRSDAEATRPFFQEEKKHLVIEDFMKKVPC